MKYTLTLFQNTNPERGRKPCPTPTQRLPNWEISEHEPRKGTETRIIPIDQREFAPISEHEPRKGTETDSLPDDHATTAIISEHEPRKGTETYYDKRYNKIYIINFRTRTPKGDGNFLVVLVIVKTSY